MHNLETSSHELRRKRTKSLIQLGSLIGQSGLLETFDIVLGKDLQKDPEQKNEIAALFKGLLVLNEIVNSEEIFHKELWSQQGLQKLKEIKKEK